ncbi:MAG: KH domain-containing protein [Eubacteriales bacterium]
MTELVRYLAEAVVSHPENVEIHEEERDNEIIIKLSVAPDDMGKVIGKQGRIAKAIRTVVKSASYKSKKKYYVEIV